MIENLQKRKKKSNFDPFRKRTEKLLFCFPARCWFQPCGGLFIFSISKKRRGTRTVRCGNSFPFFWDKGTTFRLFHQIVTTFISTRLTSFKYSVFSQFSTREGVLHITCNSSVHFFIFPVPDFSDHPKSDTPDVQASGNRPPHIPYARNTPAGRVPMQRGARFSSRLGRKKTSPKQEY